MATKRIKLTQTITRDRAEHILGELAQLILLRNKATTAMDRKVTEIRADYETKLADLGTQIEEKTELLSMWAANNPDEFPKGQKSVEMVHGRLGFRTGTPKLKTRMRKTWDKVLDTLGAMGLQDLIRTKQETNKERIIADYLQGALPLATMMEIGVEVVQEESFFVEPKLEDLATKVVA
jgi:phage host-nuclease inhibitor protein Gam